MVNKIINLFIVTIWQEYNRTIAKIPKIRDIRYIDSEEVVSEFKTKDLYNQNFILYINKNLEKQSKSFIRENIFHELTHLKDGLEYRDKYEFNDFKNIIHVLSEINASEIEMDIILSTQNEKPYSLYQDIKHIGILSLDSFMKQTVDNIEKQFMLPDKPIIIGGSGFNEKYLFYFIGYLKSLKKHDLSYQWEFKNLDYEFKIQFDEIISGFLTNRYNENDVLNICKKIQSLIIRKIYFHNKKFDD